MRSFALAVRDQNPVVYGDSEPVLSELPSNDRKAIEEMFVRAPMSPKAYIELTDAIAAAIAGPKVDVQLGPAGVQWCSKPLLEAVAENSALTGRRIHMHLLETIYQRAWADANFPDGIVRYLRDIGFLSDRLTLAHCIHARPDEIEMIAASGTRIVTNFSSNMHLRSGLAPIAAAHACGCAIAVGVDGLALDEDDDVLREMRLVQMFHGGLGFKRTWTPQEFFGLAVANGRKATGAPGTGALLPGAPADFVTIDLDRLDRDQIMPVDPIELLFARGNASLLREVVVDGRTIVSEGRCLGVDLPAIEKELRGIYRANAGKLGSFQRAWPPLSASLQNWFEAQLDCRLSTSCCWSIPFGAGLAYPVEACAAECPAACHRAGHAAAGGGAAGGGQPQLPRPRYPAAKPELGRHAGPRLPVYGDRAGADVCPGACHSGGLVGIQCARRILAYRARSDHEGSIIL